MKAKALYTLMFLAAAGYTPLSAESVVVDYLRSTGKIYSVFAVILSIFIGLAIYLYRLDKKLTKLENQINDEQ